MIEFEATLAMGWNGKERLREFWGLEEVDNDEEDGGFKEEIAMVIGLIWERERERERERESTYSY